MLHFNDLRNLKFYLIECYSFLEIIRVVISSLGAIKRIKRWRKAAACKYGKY